MVRYRRHLVPGCTFFFAVALADRRSCILTTEIASLRAAFRNARALRPFEIDAVVILPDHLHAVLTLPVGDADFSSRWRRIKSGFTQAVRATGTHLVRRDGDGFVLWQRRFWEHTIRDETDFARHVDYIHFNPVKHGHAAAAEAWPYSSLHRFIRNGILAPGWGGTARAVEGVAQAGEP